MFACVYLGTNTCNNYVSAAALLGRSHTLRSDMFMEPDIVAVHKKKMVHFV